MSTVLLRLAGPLQSWGDSSRFSRRRTATEPTKSGVIGLVAAAQGRRRTDPLEDLADLRFGVRVDQRGEVVRDFQTASDVHDQRRVMPLSHRFYLSDAVFIAGLEGDDELVAGLADALTTPAFPLYLGRRSCPPSRPLLIEVVDEPLDAALRSVPWEVGAAYRRRQGRSVHLEIVGDASAAPEGSASVDAGTARDVPRSFDPVRREYGWRDVVRLEPHVVENPAGTERVDFLALHGGA